MTGIRAMKHDILNLFCISESTIWREA